MAHAVLRRSVVTSCIALGLALALLGCARTPRPQGGAAAHEVRASAQALGGGTPSSDDRDVGLVRILGGSRGECTGKMLTQRWLVTAASCFCASDADAQNLANLTVTEGSLTAQVSALLFNPQMDIALLRVNPMLPLEQPETVWVLPVDYLTATQDPVACYGHGGSPTRLDATLDGSTAGTVFGTSDTQCGTGGLQRGVVAEAAAGASLDASDLGGPCFLYSGTARYFIGVLTSIVPSTDGTKSELQITAFDQVGYWLHAATDIWSSAECGSDVPNTAFSIDPVLFQGVPDASTFTLVAQNAFGDPDDDAAPQIYIRQSLDPQQAGGWSAVASPVLSRGVEGLTASVDGADSSLGRSTMFFTYLDPDHVQLAFWLDQTFDTNGVEHDAFLLRDNPGPMSGYQGFDGIGKRLSNVQPLLPAAHASAVENGFASPTMNDVLDWDGRRVSVGGGNVAPAGQPEIWRWSDQPSPSDMPVADITHRITSTLRASHPAWVAFANIAFRDVQGNFVTSMVSLACAGLTKYVDPWCKNDATAMAPGSLPTVTWDIPTEDLRDVALGLSAKPGAWDTDYYAVSVAHDGAMRLWWLGDGFGDGSHGHAVDLGAIGDKSSSLPKLATVSQATSSEELYMAFTADTWSARVRPIGNCLGNTPTWW